jgi:hypothetical protein
MIDMIEVPFESRHTDVPGHPNIAPAADRPVAPDRVCHTSEPYLKCAPERPGGMPRTGERSGETPPEPCSGPRRQRQVFNNVFGQSLTGGPLPSASPKMRMSHKIMTRFGSLFIRLLCRNFRRHRQDLLKALHRGVLPACRTLTFSASAHRVRVSSSEVLDFMRLFTLIPISLIPSTLARP